MTDDTTRARLLAAYYDDPRTDAEVPSAIALEHLGPLRLVTFLSGRGFITYRDLGGADAEAIRGLVAAALDHFRADPEIYPRRVEDPWSRPRTLPPRGTRRERIRAR